MNPTLIMQAQDQQRVFMWNGLFENETCIQFLIAIDLSVFDCIHRVYQQLVNHYQFDSLVKFQKVFVSMQTWNVMFWEEEVSRIIALHPKIDDYFFACFLEHVRRQHKQESTKTQHDAGMQLKVKRPTFLQFYTQMVSHVVMTPDVQTLRYFRQNQHDRYIVHMQCIRQALNDCSKNNVQLIRTPPPMTHGRVHNDVRPVTHNAGQHIATRMMHARAPTRKPLTATHSQLPRIHAPATKRKPNNHEPPSVISVKPSDSVSQMDLRSIGSSAHVSVAPKPQVHPEPRDKRQASMPQAKKLATQASPNNPKGGIRTLNPKQVTPSASQSSKPKESAAKLLPSVEASLDDSTEGSLLNDPEELDDSQQSYSIDDSEQHESEDEQSEIEGSSVEQEDTTEEGTLESSDELEKSEGSIHSMLDGTASDIESSSVSTQATQQSAPSQSSKTTSIASSDRSQSLVKAEATKTTRPTAPSVSAAIQSKIELPLVANEPSPPPPVATKQTPVVAQPPNSFEYPSHMMLMSVSPVPPSQQEPIKATANVVPEFRPMAAPIQQAQTLTKKHKTEAQTMFSLQPRPVSDTQKTSPPTNQAPPLEEGTMFDDGSLVSLDE